MDQPLGSEKEKAIEPEVYLLAHMGHSLRTPLNQVLGFSELLSEQLSGPLNDKQQAQAMGIARAGERLLRVVDDLLLLGRLSSGIVATEPGEIDPSDVSKRILPAIEHTEGAPVRLEAMNEGMVSLGLDAYWLESLLNALIRPARELSDPDNEVVVRVSQSDNGSPGSVVEVSATMGNQINAPSGCDLVQLAIDCERLIHGTGVQFLLAKTIAVDAGGSLCLDTESTSGAGYTLRCSIPHKAVPPKHPKSSQLVGAATS